MRKHPELEFMSLGLSITTYRCVPRDLRGRIGEVVVDEYLDALNKEVLSRMQLGGEAFVSNAVIRGRYVLRSCVVNFNTTAADMEAVAQISARIGREVDVVLRPAELRAKQ